MSISVKDELGEGGQVKLDKAILIYGTGGNAIATIHDVFRSHGKAQIQPGRGVSLANLQDLVIALTTDKKSAYLPDNVLSCNFTRLVWWTPSCVRPIWFSTQDKKFNKQMNGAKVTHPAMLFCVTGGSFRVFALACDTRPTPETPVYQAPYYNIYASGRMCVGNAAVPKMLMPSNIAKFESAFFGSAFTHNALGAKLCNHIQGHNGFWLHLKGRGKHPRRKTVPVKWLAKMPLTVGKVIEDDFKE